MCNIVELGGVINGNFKRKVFTDLDNVDKKIKQIGFNGDIYQTVYRYESKNQDESDFIAPMYFDLDIDNIEENYGKIKIDLMLVIRQLITLFKINEEDIQIYFSGSKGFHVIIDEKIFGFEKGRSLNKDLKLIALKLKTFTVNKTIDTKIYDYKRLFRVVNTINHKTGLYKVPVSLFQIRNFTYNELINYAKSQKEIFSKEYELNEYAKENFEKIIEGIRADNKRHVNIKVAKDFIKKKKMLPCVKYILQNGARKGQRNNTMVALASSLFQIENNFDEVLETIKAWNETKCEEPLSEREVETTVSSAYRIVSSGRIYGCTTFMELDLCVKNCPIYKD